MSLSGSLLLLFYYLIHNKIWLFSYKLQDILLKGSVLYFLVPLVFLEPLYKAVLGYLSVDMSQKADGIYEYVYYYSEINGTSHFSTAYKLQVGFLIGWFLVALTILLVRVGCYIRNKKRLLNVAKPITEGSIFELLEKVRLELNIKRRIRLYDVQVTPFTMGVLHPIICFDASEDMVQLEMTFQHECKHIKRLDVFTRQLVSLVVSIHWFNPLVYLLHKKTEWISEVCCDEAVTKKYNKREKATYAQMLLEHIEIKSPAPVFYSALSKNAKSIEERIIIIMKSKTRTKFQTALAVMLLGIVFFMDSWTVLAYPHAVEISGETSDTFSPDEKFVFMEDWGESPLEDGYIFLSEEQFVDEEGNVYPVYEEGISTMAMCRHTWVSGKVQKHVVNTNGGCTIYSYSAKRCSRCGDVVLGERLNTQINEVCLH